MLSSKQQEIKDEHFPEYNRCTIFLRKNNKPVRAFVCLPSMTEERIIVETLLENKLLSEDVKENLRSWYGDLVELTEESKAAIEVFKKTFRILFTKK